MKIPYFTASALIIVFSTSNPASFLHQGLASPILSAEQSSVTDHNAFLEDMPSNHNSDRSVVPQLRRSGGKLQVSWGGIRERILETAMITPNFDTERLKLFQATLIVNGVPVQENLPWDKTSTIFSEPPSGQMDYYIVYKENGNVVDTSKWAMRETSDGQNIEPGSFSGKFAGEAYGFQLNQELKAAGFNEELSQTSVRLGNLKVVWVLNPNADNKVRAFIRAAIDGVEVKPAIGAGGEPESVIVRDRKTKQIIDAGKNDFHFKVDAAFNGNAFFWDDMLVALATAPYHPWLAKSTLEFWLQVQEQNGGVIPREVRKDSLISLWFPQNVRFPHAPKANLSYTNPYLMNWVADKIYRFNPSAENLEFLKRVSVSIERYSAWMEEHRSIRDSSGRIIGFNGSALGSGLDNSRSEVGNDNEDAGYRHGFVDFLSQQISMLKDNAKWNLLFARAAARESDRAVFVAKARDSQRRAVAYQKTLNENYWNQERGFYFDISIEPSGEIKQDLEHTVISGFWPLYANAVDRDKVSRIVEMQFNPEAFGGSFPFPANARNSIRADHQVRYQAREKFHEEDGYWDKWAHWPSMAMAVLAGLRRSGRIDLAYQYAAAFVKKMAQSSTKTVEESYGEERILDENGKTHFIPRALQHAQHPHRADFAGWGKGPGLENTLEDGIGIQPTYRNGLEWNLRTSLKIGDSTDHLILHALQYNGGTISYLDLERTGMDSYMLRVKSEKPFQLNLNSLLDVNNRLTPEIQSRSSSVLVQGANLAQVIPIVLAPVARTASAGLLSDKTVNSCEALF